MRYYLIIYTRYVAQVVCINLAILKSLDFVEIKLIKKHTIQSRIWPIILVRCLELHSCFYKPNRIGKQGYLVREFASSNKISVGQHTIKLAIKM